MHIVQCPSHREWPMEKWMFGTKLDLKPPTGRGCSQNILVLVYRLLRPYREVI